MTITEPILHGAYICPIKLLPHPNADRLQLAIAGGYQSCVGLEHTDGELMVVFSSDLQISEEYAQVHDLIARKDENGERAGGYFPDNRKVRPQKLRGVRSDVYLAGLDSLEYTGADISKIKMGELFTELNGHQICTKYINPRTKVARGNVGKLRKQHDDFHKMYDHGQMAREYVGIPDGALITISAKLHGTSARVGKVWESVEQKRTLWDKIRRRTRKVNEWVTLVGTRNVVLDGAPTAVGYYEDESFRHVSADIFSGYLHNGETVYGELVGWVNENTPIMSPYDLTKSKEFKKWGKGNFSYGTAQGQCHFYVYRITEAVQDMNGKWFPHDLPFWQMQARAHHLGLKVVPLLEQFISLSPQDTLDKALKYIDGDDCEADFIDPSHIREGVVVRIDSVSGTYGLKLKTVVFRTAEGLIKESDDSIDLEEVS